MTESAISLITTGVGDVTAGDVEVAGRCMLEMPACLHRAPRCLKRDEARDGERGSPLGDLRLGVSSIRDSICICVSCALVSSELSFLSSFVVPLVSPISLSVFYHSFGLDLYIQSLHSLLGSISVYDFETHRVPDSRSTTLS